MRKGNRGSSVNPGSSSRRLRGGPRSSGRNAPSEIYEDLLEEVLRQSSPPEERPLKKRKSQRDPSEVIVVEDLSSADVKSGQDSDVGVIESSTNEVTDDEEMEWDNVDLNTASYSEDVTETQTSPVIREVHLVSTPQKSLYVFNFPYSVQN
jgi:hypothetical protein